MLPGEQDMPRIHSNGKTTNQDSDSPSAVSRRLARGTSQLLLGLAGLSVSCFGHAAPGNTGGDWYPKGDSCSAGPGVDSYGGRCATTDADSASGAKVDIRDDTPGVWAYGGYAADTANVPASGNTITLHPGATVSALIAGRAMSTESNGVADDNTVYVYGGTAGTVYGGQSRAGAKGNRVFITGGSIGDVAGGQGNSGNLDYNEVYIDGAGVSISSLVSGARNNGSGTANDNVVSIKDATVAGSVFGGYTQGGGAQRNTVRISGSATIGATVYGGYSSGSGNAHDNRVIIEGTPNIADTMLIGGYAPSGTLAGNVLEIRTSGVKVGNVLAFQEMHFILPADIKPGTTVLTVSGKMPATRDNRNPQPEPSDLRGIKIGVALQEGGNVLKSGDRVVLLQNSLGVITDPDIARADVSGYQGISLKYKFDLSADTDKLIATAQSGPEVREQTKAPVEGKAGTMAMAVQGGDLAAGAGIARAMAATSGVSGTSTFGATGGTSSRYESGSHVDVKGFSLMVGAAKRIECASGESLAGVFFEGGRGRFDTFNEFTSGIVRGSGDSRYAGVGMLLRHDFKAGASGKPYVEGSLRVGRVSSDWTSNDMVGATRASYDTSSTYYGAHVGVGYVLPLAKQYSLDIFGKYYWTHQGGDNVTIAGDPYEFKAMDSHRTRVGARLGREFGKTVTGYAGATWEREFDGQARATVYGLDTPSPSLKGNTAMLEIGLDMKPNPDKPMTIDVGAQLYRGMRHGVSATAKMMWMS